MAGGISERQFAEICAGVAAEREQVWASGERPKADALWYALFLRLRDRIGVIPAPALRPVTGDEEFIDICQKGIADMMRNYMEGWYDFGRLARECIEGALGPSETS